MRVKKRVFHGIQKCSASYCNNEHEPLHVIHNSGSVQFQMRSLMWEMKRRPHRCTGGYTWPSWGCCNGRRCTWRVEGISIYSTPCKYESKIDLKLNKKKLQMSEDSSLLRVNHLETLHGLDSANFADPALSHQEGKLLQFTQYYELISSKSFQKFSVTIRRPLLSNAV